MRTASPPAHAPHSAPVGVTPRPGSFSPRVVALGLVLPALAALALLYRFSPFEYHFLPACPIHQATGLFCPGCGTARALYALLHGNWRLATDLNLLTVLLIPLIAGIAILLFVAAVRDNQVRTPAFPRWAIALLLCSIAVFTVWRNLPGPWGTFLAP